MFGLKEKLKKQNGFVLVVALVLTALTLYFCIKLLKTTLNTQRFIREANNYDDANVTAYSLMEFLKFELMGHEAGYNYSTKCDKYGNAEGGDTTKQQLCQKFLEDFHLTNKNAILRMEINGRSKTKSTADGVKIDEKLEGSCPGINRDCFVVPMPGTGDAGERCKGYKPFKKYGSETYKNTVKQLIDQNGQPAPETCSLGVNCIEQIDYSCNWNKLTFGSNLTDRAVIPLYYDDGSKFISPFNSDNTKNGGYQAQYLIVRLRTPCKPCAKPDDPPNANNRECESGSDETICKDEDRYVLDEGTGAKLEDNEVVVQWQITGKCPDSSGNLEECGMIQYKEYETVQEMVKIKKGFSGITEGRINQTNINYFNPIYETKHIILYNILKAIDTTTYRPVYINKFPTSPEPLILKLPSMEYPVLSLFLYGKLFERYTGERIPYLEYQVLTDKPVANAKIILRSFAEVDGNGYEYIEEKEEHKELIDFAVQN